MSLLVIVVGLMAIDAPEPATSQACMTVRAQRWWNVGRVQRAGGDSKTVELRNDHRYALLFFGTRDADLLHKVGRTLNRLDARRDWGR